MSVITDTKASFERVLGYGNRMKSLLSRYGVRSTDDVKRVAKDSAFKSELAALWEEILKAEGGAITLTILLSTIACAKGGVGIAAGGGAIGLPLILILAPAGYFAGQELDSEGYTTKIVDRFESLLKMARNFDSQQYNEMFADTFHKLSASIQKLDIKRHEYTDRLIERFKRFRGKTGEPSS
jgi:hypothetical protein